MTEGLLHLAGSRELPQRGLFTMGIAAFAGLWKPKLQMDSLLPDFRFSLLPSLASYFALAKAGTLALEAKVKPPPDSPNEPLLAKPAAPTGLRSP